MTILLGQENLVKDYLTKYRRRLTAAYARAAHELQRLEIPFTPTSSGPSMFIDLSSWLHYFSGQDYNLWVPSPDARFCDWLIKHGLYMNPGQVCFEISLDGNRVYQLIFLYAVLRD